MGHDVDIDYHLLFMRQPVFFPITSGRPTTMKGVAGMQNVDQRSKDDNPHVVRFPVYSLWVLVLSDPF